MYKIKRVNLIYNNDLALNFSSTQQKNTFATLANITHLQYEIEMLKCEQVIPVGKGKKNTDIYRLYRFDNK